MYKRQAEFFNGAFTSPIACRIPFVNVDNPKKTTPGLPTAKSIVEVMIVSF